MLAGSSRLTLCVLNLSYRCGEDVRGCGQAVVGHAPIDGLGHALLRRASARLAHDDRLAPYGIDAAKLVDYADALIDDLAAGAEITPKRLRPRLVAVLPQ